MGKMIRDIELLPKERQEAIRRDIENRILPQARNVFENTLEMFPEYIKSEIEKAVQSMNKMINESQREGAIMLNISEVYVFNKERIRALKALEEELLGRNAMDLQQEHPEQQPKLEGKTQQNNDNKQPQQETEREKEYFAKAIQAGLMKKDGENYKWLHNNGLKSSLGYFLKMVFNPKGTAQIHYKRMENLFNVSRLDSAIDGALSVKKPQKWRKEIDALFDD